LLIKDVHSISADQDPVFAIREKIKIADSAMWQVSRNFKALEGAWHGFRNGS
jgi:hypothetical protein